ncbi:MAG: polysaccharide deacetylase family protein [Candidatus Peregrinibacteria bacterium]|nr:polysaccharide deacetylase family protein [Candidatus Peregrinibacteria bacterium]
MGNSVDANVNSRQESPGFNSLFDEIKKITAEASKPPVLPDTESKVPVVMYHYVRIVDKVKDPLGYDLSINPTDFEKQMKYLKDQGYTTIHLEDLLDKKVPKKAIVLSFDDGLEDFYTTALPILQKYGFTASDAVITGMIGQHEHMTNDQIRECIKAGIEITSHTVTHFDMSKLTKEQLHKQLAESKSYLEKTFGIKVDGFIYPSGRYNDLAVQTVKDEGYKIAATTKYGEADLAKDNILLLPRVRIDNRDSYNGFVKKLERVEESKK